MPRPVSNPANPWASTYVDWLGEPPASALEVFEEDAKSLLTRNDSPDVPFRWSANPYRGCFHACAYCYARPSHQYLGFGAGTDFDRKIVVKRNAPELLARELARRKRPFESIAFSGVTDCYQPLEATYGVTRACLEVCSEFAAPVGIITKGALVRRDVDVLVKLAARSSAKVYLSIPFADEAHGRAIEPFASPVTKRFEALRVLSQAGIETGVALAPIIPGLNDSDVVQILERAREAGARSAFMILLRLPAEVGPVFWERVRDAFPDRASKIESALRQVRGGRLNDARFGSRMSGSGPRWAIVERLFATTCRRLGLEHGESAQVARTDEHSPRGQQRTMF